MPTSKSEHFSHLGRTLLSKVAITFVTTNVSFESSVYICLFVLSFFFLSFFHFSLFRTFLFSFLIYFLLFIYIFYLFIYLFIIFLLIPLHVIYLFICLLVCFTLFCQYTARGWGTSMTSLYRSRIQVCPAFLTLFFKAKFTPIDLALRTISPIDPEYYGTRPPWDLNSQNHILSSRYQGQTKAQLIYSSQQHVGAPTYGSAWLGFTPWPCRLVSPIEPQLSSSL